ncbi:hypothetical protein RTBOTA2_004015 [Rhodotorula toruloides]|nr:hypothetical protein RTBOTA2_004015 [Rhodotorula toruloides]
MESTLGYGCAPWHAHYASREAYSAPRAPRRRSPGVETSEVARLPSFPDSAAALYQSHDIGVDRRQSARRRYSDSLDETVEPSWESRRCSSASASARRKRSEASGSCDDWDDAPSISSRHRSSSASTSSESLSPRIARITAFTSKLAQITSTRAGFEDAVRIHAGATSFDLPELELPWLPTLFPHGTPVLDVDDESAPFSPFTSSDSSISASDSTPFVTPLPTPLSDLPSFLPSRRLPTSPSALSPRSTRSSIDSVFSTLSLSPVTAEDTPLTSAAPSTTTSPRHSFADLCETRRSFGDCI